MNVCSRFAVQPNVSLQQTGGLRTLAALATIDPPAAELGRELDHDLTRMITEELYSTESPSAVIAAMRALAGEWRESKLPEVLKRARVISVDCRLEGSTCTPTLSRQWYGPSERMMDLRVQAAVRPAEHGTAVHVVAGYYTPGGRLAAIGGTIIGGVAVLLFHFPPVVVVGLAVGLLILRYLLVRDANNGLSRASSEAANYLVGRIEGAIAQAEHARISAPAS